MRKFSWKFVFFCYRVVYLAAEPKQVIRALRPRTTIHPKSQRPSMSCLKIDRSLADSTSSKLPPNIYHIQGYLDEISKRKMGKLGIYKCFTVPRDEKTLTNHFTQKREADVCDFFYDLPTMSGDMSKSSNRYKMRFLKSKRFDDNFNASSSSSPLASIEQKNPNVVTQNTRLKSTSYSAIVNPPPPPFFYYPSTTVPEKEMSFNRDKIFTPAPGRYNPHDVTCKCYLNQSSGCGIECPGNVDGDGHQHVFKSNVFRLVRPSAPQVIRRRRSRFESSTSFVAADDNLMDFVRPRPPREPFSFRLKRSRSLEEMSDSRNAKEFRFNTVIKRKHLVSVKTGRPVGFLTATPRFFESRDASSTKNCEKEKKKVAIENDEKPKRKPMSKERLEILATPKNSQTKFSAALSANKIFNNDPEKLTVTGNIMTTTKTANSF